MSKIFKSVVLTTQGSLIPHKRKSHEPYGTWIQDHVFQQVLEG